MRDTANTTAISLQRHHSLEALNTFGLTAKADAFFRLEDIEQFPRLLEKYQPADIRILGGGSNILLTRDLPGLLVKNDIKGIRVVDEDEESVLLEIGGGEPWHDFVMWAIRHDYGGVENMALIPGTVGAAPIQNIGAYGAELKDVFEGLLAFRLDTGEHVFYSRPECGFGYRDSIFKRQLKGKICIYRLYLRLSKPPHQLNTSYGAIRSELAASGLGKPGIKDVAEAVIRIRQSKLPDPKDLGNSGSFFKNPEIPLSQYEALRRKHPGMPSYPLPDEQVKVPAAWLIDQCGFKGLREGRTGCYQGQPLVLVNYGGASGAEIWAFAQKVQSAVERRFGLRLQAEVNIW